MPATITGRGSQVILTGQVRRAARGAAGTSLLENTRIKTDLEFLGSISAGYSHDGRTSTGGPAHDVAVLAPETELDATMGTPGGPFLPLTGGIVSGDTTFNTHLTLGTSNSVVSGATWKPLLYLNTGLTGSTTAAGATNVMQFTVNGDSLDAAGSAGQLVNYMGLVANFGGATMKGNRQGFAAQIGLTAPSGNPQGGSYVGFVSTAAAVTSDNGTGLTQTTIGGSLYAANLYVYTAGSAQNFGLICGMEINPAIGAGTSATQAVGLQVVATSAHKVRGAWHNDTGYLFAAQVGSIGMDIGYAVGTSMGTWPIQAGGSLFRAQFSSGASPVARYGVALHEVSFPQFASGAGTLGGAFVSNGFGVDGLGAIRCGTAYLTPDSGGVVLDAHGSVGTGTPTVAAGGTGHSVGDILYDPYGGIYTVASTGAGGAVLTVTVLTGTLSETHQPYWANRTPPSNPVPTTAWTVASSATGCTLNLSWDTSRTRLAINTGGGPIWLSGQTTGFANVDFQSGITFNNSFGSSHTDLSKGIQFYAGYGIALSSARVNYVSGDTHAFVVGSSDIVTFTSGGTTFIAPAYSTSVMQVGFGSNNAIKLTTGAPGSNAVLLVGQGTDASPVMDFQATGTGGFRFVSKVGFNNTAPIAKPTVSGAKGSNAALASLLAALAAYGLVTDSSTA